tara:strand:- start:186 stop:422 length:237 start_codon:yes stop_codon:yes gene_type:complete
MNEKKLKDEELFQRLANAIVSSNCLGHLTGLKNQAYAERWKAMLEERGWEFPKEGPTAMLIKLKELGFEGVQNGEGSW